MASTRRRGDGGDQRHQGGRTGARRRRVHHHHHRRGAAGRRRSAAARARLERGADAGASATMQRWRSWRSARSPAFDSRDRLRRRHRCTARSRRASTPTVLGRGGPRVLRDLTRGVRTGDHAEREIAAASRAWSVGSTGRSDPASAQVQDCHASRRQALTCSTSPTEGQAGGAVRSGARRRGASPRCARSIRSAPKARIRCATADPQHFVQLRTGLGRAAHGGLDRRRAAAGSVERSRRHN